jgi:hypothetical protein
MLPNADTVRIGAPGARQYFNETCQSVVSCVLKVISEILPRLPFHISSNLTDTKRVLLISGTKCPNNSEDFKELKSLMKD